MSISSLKLFSLPALTPVPQAAAECVVPEVQDEATPKVSVSTEGVDLNCNQNNGPTPNKPIAFSRYVIDENRAKWIIFGATEMHIDNCQVRDIVAIFSQVCKDDEVIFYLPYWIDAYSAIAILNAAHTCEGNITVVGAQQLSVCSALLLLCGKIRHSEYDYFIVKQLGGMAYGSTNDNAVTVEQLKVDQDAIMKLFEISGLLSPEDIELVQVNNAQQSVYGHILAERVAEYNKVGYDKIHDLFVK